jgi:translation initiation factor IF-1
MRHEEGIHTVGKIVEILGDGRYRASLPNGKIVFSFLSPDLRDNEAPSFEIDDGVALRLSPYDFSRAEITKPENSRPKN